MLSYCSALTRCIWLIAGVLLIAPCLLAQTLLLDRGRHSDWPAGDVGRIGWAKDDKAFVGDDFVVGHDGETWVLDKIRTWAVAGSGRSSSADLGALFGKITLFGALANDQGTVECACHNLIPMKSAVLSTIGSSDPDVAISQSDTLANVWQIDFENLRWSVPGAVTVEFGIKAVERSNAQQKGTFKWLNAVSPTDGDHRLRVFGNDGALLSFLDRKAQNSGTSNAIDLQVWGHLLTKIAIQPAPAGYRVALFGEKRFDVRNVDVSSIRFGLAGASPSSAPQYEDANGDGITDLVLTFSVAVPRDQLTSLSACLNLNPAFERWAG